MNITWKVDHQQKAVHFQLVQDIVLTPINFTLPFAAVKVMAGNIMSVEGQQALQTRPALVKPT